MKKLLFLKTLQFSRSLFFYTRSLLFAFSCVLLLSACSLHTNNTYVAEDPFTLSNWKQALELRNQERYELSYHYYTIALSSANSNAAIMQIKKEMEDLQRVIHSVR